MVIRPGISAMILSGKAPEYKRDIDSQVHLMRRFALFMICRTQRLS